MKRAFFVALMALLFVSPAIAEDDDKTQVAPVPVLAPETLALPSLPAELEMPASTEGIIWGCWNRRMKERRSLAQYTLIVGVALELPAHTNFAVTGATLVLDYGLCRFQKNRQQKMLEQTVDSHTSPLPLIAPR